MGKTSHQNGFSPIAKDLVRMAIVFAAYVVAGKIGQSTSTVRSGNLGPVWPAYGIALAAFILYGNRIWPGVAAATFFVAAWSPASMAAAVAQAAGSTIAAATGGFLLRRLNFDRALTRLQDAMSLIVAGAFGSSLVSATIGTLALYATHSQPYSATGRAWLIYWLGDSTGVMLVTPLVLTFSDLLVRRFWRRWVELAILLLLLVVATASIFSDSFLPWRVHVLAFAVLPFVMWGAIRFQVCGAVVTTFLIAAIGTAETALGRGPFAHNTPFANAVLLDVFFAVLALCGIVLATVIAEREWVQKEHERLVREQAVTEMRLRLATIVESSDDAIIGVDLDLTITDWNKGAELLYGYSSGEVIGKPISILIPPERERDCYSIIDKLKQGTAVRHYETVRRRKDGALLEISLTASPIFDANGQVGKLSSIEHNIAQRKRQEELLRNSEERFRLATHAANMFAYEWDAPSDMIVRSGDSNRMLGIDDSIPLMGREALARVYAEDRGKVETAWAELNSREPQLKVSCRIVRADNTAIWVEVHGLAHFNEDGSLERIVGMVVDTTERKRFEEALANANRRLIDAQEAERTRIARELHDDISQRVSLLSVELEQLARITSDASVPQADRLHKLRQDTLELSRDIQFLSRELHSARLEYLGIASATQGLCRELADKYKIEIDCKIQALPRQLAPATSLCLFRVLQEALNNSVKHSGAKRVEVSLWSTKDQIHLKVSDSGVGFDPEAAKASQGLGLISMEERVKLLDGKFAIESHANRGTTIYAEIPIPSAEGTALAAS